MRKSAASRIAPIVAILLAAPLLFWIEYGPPLTEDAVLLPLLNMTLTRMLAAAVFLVILIALGFRVLHPLRPPFGKALLVSLLPLAVVINNLPILSLIRGDAYLVHSDARYIVAFALECLAIGLFEEIAFRGVVLLTFAKSRRRTHVGLLVSILLSSAVFAAMHLVNLAAGAGFGATIMQIGYSFLIGAMCAVILFKTANLWLCVALHAIYDFCGMLLPTLGDGSWWDTPTIVFTVLLALATTAYMIVLFVRMQPAEVDRIYPCTKKEPE